MKKILHKLKASINGPILAVGGIILFTALMVLMNSIFAPEKPVINITSDSEFTGGSFVFEGNVVADCYCDIELELNNKSLEIDENGNFSKEIEISETKNNWEYELEATAKGKFINKSSQREKEEGELTRTLAKVEISSETKESDSGTTAITINAPVGTKLIVTAETSYFALDPYADNDEELSSQEIEVDETEIVNLELPFKNTYNNRSTIYKVVASFEGYADAEKELEIKNLNFDEARMKEEKVAYQKQKEIEKIKNSMETYTGSGDIQIAVSKDIKKSRTVGYRYVLDPENYQFVSFVLFAKNTGYLSEHVNPNYVTVIDESYRSYNYDQATYNYGNYFDSTDLQPNTYTDGWLAFILPKSHHKFTVVYNDGSNVIRKEIYVD